jgi:hypothetical protein
MTMYSAVGFSMLVESREILDHAKHQPLQQNYSYYIFVFDIWPEIEY